MSSTWKWVSVLVFLFFSLSLSLSLSLFLSLLLFFRRFFFFFLTNFIYVLQLHSRFWNFWRIERKRVLLGFLYLFLFFILRWLIFMLAPLWSSNFRTSRSSNEKRCFKRDFNIKLKQEMGNTESIIIACILFKGKIFIIVREVLLSRMNDLFLSEIRCN